MMIIAIDVAVGDTHQDRLATVVARPSKYVPKWSEREHRVEIRRRRHDRRRAVRRKCRRTLASLRMTFSHFDF
jgi:hypothetical protein